MFGQPVIDLTEPFGGYMDQGQAMENLKALFQGGIEDENEKDEEELGAVDGLQVNLLPHQVEGLRWMISKETGKRKNGVLPKGGILADDMGLGKTIQSIGLILSNPLPPGLSSADKEERKLPAALVKSTLVVAPLALIKQWEKEIDEKVSSSHKLRVYVHHGPQRTKSYQALKKYDVVITTYQVLVSEHGNSSVERDGLQVGCFGVHWYRVILDEAHSVKNRNAKASQACCALKAQYRWCLTGTPMQNNLDELQSLIKFLRIKPYNDLSSWREQITNPMKNGRGDVAIKRLQVYLKHFMKRRTKEILKKEGALNFGGKASAHQHGTQPKFKITERKIEKVAIDFSPEERQFYQYLEQRADDSLERMIGKKELNYASALVLLLRLRQACNHPELVGGKLAKDSEALSMFTAGRSSKSGTSGNASSSQSQEIDNVADLFGGLTVETKQCETCMNELDEGEMASGATKCKGCRANLKKLRRQKRQSVDNENSTVKFASGKSSSRKKHAADEEGCGSDGDINGDDTKEVSDLESLAAFMAAAPDLVDLDSPEKQKAGADAGHETDDDSGAESDRCDVGEVSPRLMISTKIKHVLQILNKHAGEHKFIIFSQFTSMLDFLEPFLQRDGLSFTRYDGSMRNDLREASLDRLRNEEDIRVLLCSLKCGSLGLNLTAASRVIILEPFWNPFVEEQAIDRVHRLNQTMDVVVYKITINDTVEERILELQEKKRELANATIEGKAAAKLSLKDMLRLFRRDAEYAPRADEAATTTTTGLKGSRPGDVYGMGRRQPAEADLTAERVASDVNLIYGRRW
ncbi:MAG: hypothetical protein M1826_002561 [Phylliscum demangeonii]|nr:MAG: hypothetical protein M1826_002561 [Phylliscum demangeonii]